MPIRWSNSAARSSPLVSAMLSSIAKTSSLSSPRAAAAASSKAARKSTTANSAKWSSSNSNNGARTTAQSSPMYHSNKNSTYRHNSSSSSSSSSSSIRDTLNTFTALSKNIAIAGTGTVASTLLALYLATIVEKSAHELLYDNFPEKYYLVREEDLPECVKEREMTRRLLWGEEEEEVVKQGNAKVSDENNSKSHNVVMTGKMVGLLADPTQMMDMFSDDHQNDEFRIQEIGGKSVGQIIQEEEQIFETQLSRNNELGGVGLDAASGTSLNTLPKKLSSSWWGEETTLFALYSKKQNSSSTAKSLLERKRIQEEARLIQEKLMNVAMTA